MISGDREQLARVLVHLVTHAVEAMPQGGNVAIKARTVPAGIEMEISDTGTGIAPEMISRAFEPLFTTKRNSAGLGLAVVQQIVEAHGGTVHLDSKPGAGTRITFVLRRASE